MFYKCPKCSRVWEYPLEACPFDFAPLSGMESKTAKVVSVSKVSIPTLFHPAAPYYSLLLQDEQGNLWAHKSETEFKAGDEFKLMPNASAVAIWRIKFDARAAIKKAIELIGGIDINSGSKVVVMPTLAAASHEYFRDNTSPKFLDAVLSILTERGVKPENITVGSQSFDELPITAAAQKSGLLGLAAKYKIMPVDLAAGEFEKVVPPAGESLPANLAFGEARPQGGPPAGEARPQGGPPAGEARPQGGPPAGEARPQGGQLEIAKAVLGADLVINLAMEKIGQAAATQNMFKVLKKENYLGLKYLSSDEEIAKLLEPLLGRMVVVGEAENVQRSYKLITFMGLVFAAKSARNLDRVFNEVAMALKLPEIVKDCNIESIPVAGRSIKEVQFRAEIF